jgi:hypothetical protein
MAYRSDAAPASAGLPHHLSAQRAAARAQARAAEVTTRIPDWLAYLYAPIIPALKRIKITGHPRRPNPADILPAGLQRRGRRDRLHRTGALLLRRPGNCYVTESGHKVDTPPRIYRSQSRDRREGPVL